MSHFSDILGVSSDIYQYFRMPTLVSGLIYLDMNPDSILNSQTKNPVLPQMSNNLSQIKQHNNIKKIFLIFTAIFIFFSIHSLSFSESIFLKNGNIVEGKIIKDTDQSVTVRLKSKKTKTYPRRNLIRILFTETYKEKKYIYKKDGSLIEGYIVFEEDASYIVRRDLSKDIEIKILKKEIKTLSIEKIVLKKIINVVYKPEWLIGFGFHINGPTGILNKDFEQGFGYRITAINPLNKWYHLGFSLRQIFFENRTSYPSDIENMNFLITEVQFGYNWRVSSFLNLIPYVGTGMVQERVLYQRGTELFKEAGEKTKLYMTPSVSIGIKAPVGKFRYKAISPYIEFLWIPNSTATIGVLTIGINLLF